MWTKDYLEDCPITLTAEALTIPIMVNSTCIEIRPGIIQGRRSVG